MFKQLTSIFFAFSVLSATQAGSPVTQNCDPYLSVFNGAIESIEPRVRAIVDEALKRIVDQHTSEPSMPKDPFREATNAIIAKAMEDINDEALKVIEAVAVVIPEYPSTVIMMYLGSGSSASFPLSCLGNIETLGDLTAKSSNEMTRSAKSLTAMHPN